MYDCPNCGMMPFACVCIPWCHEHDVAQPCKRCPMYREHAGPAYTNPNPFAPAEPEQPIDATRFIDPWYVSLWRFLFGE